MRVEFLEVGKKFQYKATGAVAYHQLVLSGGLVGVASKAGVEDDVVVCEASGVFTMPKEAGTAFAQGAKVYYNATTDKITNTTTDTYIGIAWIASASADTSISVKINA